MFKIKKIFIKKKMKKLKCCARVRKKYTQMKYFKRSWYIN